MRSPSLREFLNSSAVAGGRFALPSFVPDRVRGLFLTLILTVCLIVGTVRPAAAYYDDIHYALNYYIARVVGFTPKQSHRLASLCVMVDYAPATEPTQFTAGGRAITENWKASAIVLGPSAARAITALLKNSSSISFHLDRMPTLDDPAKLRQSAVEAELDLLPAELETLLHMPEFKGVFGAQWKFHAFRDLDRFPESKLPGPDATAADKAILDQRQVLLREAKALKNLGIFLHYFQDEIPHAGYCIGGGHWVLMPGVNRPIGATTDFLSQRSVQENLDFVRDTAKYMMDFMKMATNGEQKPLVSSPDAVVARLRATIDDLRRVNDAPPSLRTIKDVLYSKYLHWLHGSGVQGNAEEEVKYAQHGDGPKLNEAIAALVSHLDRDGMVEKTVPPEPLKIDLFLNPNSTGADIVNPDATVMYGNVNVHIKDPMSAPPYQIRAVAWSVPSQKGEKRAICASGISFVPDTNLMNGTGAVVVMDAPVGEVEIELQYVSNKGALIKSYKTLVNVDKRIVELEMSPGTVGKGSYVLESVEVPRKIKNGVKQETNFKDGYFVENYTETSHSSVFTPNDPANPYHGNLRSDMTWQRPPSEFRPGQEFSLTSTGTSTSWDNKTFDCPGAYTGSWGVVPIVFSGSSAVSTFKIPDILPPDGHRARIAIGYGTTYWYRYRAGATTPGSTTVLPVAGANSAKTGPATGGNQVANNKPAAGLKPTTGAAKPGAVKAGPPSTGKPQTPKEGNQQAGAKLQPPTKPTQPTTPPDRKPAAPAEAANRATPATTPGTPIAKGGWDGHIEGAELIADDIGIRLKAAGGKESSFKAWSKTSIGETSTVTLAYSFDVTKKADNDLSSVEFVAAAGANGEMELFSLGTRSQPGSSEVHFVKSQGKETPIKSFADLIQFKLQRTSDSVAISFLDGRTSKWLDVATVPSGSTRGPLRLGIRVRTKTASDIELYIAVADISTP